VDLLLVPFDDRCRPNAGGVWIVAKFLSSAPLAKKIPILIEFDFDLHETHIIAVRELTSFVQALLFMNQRFDVFQDGLIGGVFRHDARLGILSVDAKHAAGGFVGAPRQHGHCRRYRRDSYAIEVAPSADAPAFPVQLALTGAITPAIVRTSSSSPLLFPLALVNWTSTLSIRPRQRHRSSSTSVFDRRTDYEAGAKHVSAKNRLPSG
jgi:hypothetical protein